MPCPFHEQWAISPLSMNLVLLQPAFAQQGDDLSWGRVFNIREWANRLSYQGIQCFVSISFPIPLSHSPLVKLNWGSGSLPYYCHHSNAHGTVLDSTKYSDSQDYWGPHMTLAFLEGHRTGATCANKAVSDVSSSGNLCSSLFSRCLRCEKARSTLGKCTNCPDFMPSSKYYFW